MHVQNLLCKRAFRSAAMVQTNQWPIVHKAVTQKGHFNQSSIDKQINSLLVSLYKEDISNQQSSSIVIQRGHFKSTVLCYTSRTFQINSLLISFYKEGILSQLSTVINRGHFKPTIYCFTKTFKTNSISLLSLCKEDILRQ